MTTRVVGSISYPVVSSSERDSLRFRTTRFKNESTTPPESKQVVRGTDPLNTINCAMGVNMTFIKKFLDGHFKKSTQKVIESKTVKVRFRNRIKISSVSHS